MQNVYHHILLPQNYIAEEIFLGNIITYPKLFSNTIKNINTEYFFFESHKIIYMHLHIINKKNKIDIFNLIYSLQEKKVLKDTVQISRIIKLIKQSQIFNASINNKFYLKELLQILYDNYSKRLIIQYAYNIIQLSYNQKISSEQIYIKASQYLNYIFNTLNQKNLDNLQNLIGNLITNLKQYEKKFNKFNKSLYSGFEQLDILTNGLPKGDLIVIAGRPSMGKTSLAINIAYNILQNTDTQICIFSLEMTKIQILHKLISIGSTIPLHHIITGDISKNQWNTIQQICQKLMKSRVYINDTANIAIEDINYISKSIIQVKHSTFANIIIIDYLQLIQVRNLNSESRTQELTYITRQLKILAQNLDIPIIILSQLNRKIETRLNKKPLLSDLKESGCIQYDILTNTNNINEINIKHTLQTTNNIRIILPYLDNKLCIHNTTYTFQYCYNIISRIYIFIENIFSCITYKASRLSLTGNHKLLLPNKWSKQNQLKHKYNIITYNLQFQILNLLEKKNTLHIFFMHINYVYDIKRDKYINFFYNFIILHNSIEQDADIVIMLYNTGSKSENLLNSKIIDIVVSKNRNGSTGSFQLIFNLPSTIFINTNNY